MKTLESILEERGLFSFDEQGNQYISDRYAAEEAYFEYVQDDFYSQVKKIERKIFNNCL